MARTFLRDIVEAPAVVLGKTVDITKNIVRRIKGQKEIKDAKEYWKSLGPGLTTGAADDDPSGVATYSQAGARIGLVTGRGLAANIRIHYPKWVLYTCTFLLFGANSLNIGADLGAMAKAVQLIYPKISFDFLILAIAIFSLALQIFTTYDRYARYLKYLALVLLAYVFSALIANLDFNQILMKAFIPTLTFSKDEIFIITAILGSTISPYLFFLANLTRS